MEPPPIRVYVVEDHPVMRTLLCEAVERQGSCRVVGAAHSAEAALEALGALGADLVLVDVSLPQMSGVELVRVLVERFPDLACLMVSGHTEPAYAERALEAGARGYVLKGRPEDLAPGIRAAVRDARYLSRPLLEKLADHPALGGTP